MNSFVKHDLAHLKAASVMAHRTRLCHRRKQDNTLFHQMHTLITMNSTMTLTRCRFLAHAQHNLHLMVN
jgi:hypothetical protein